MRSWIVLPLLCAACATNDPERHSPIAAAGRVLAIDFGPAAANRRAAAATAPMRALASELRRTDALQGALLDVPREAGRLGEAKADAQALVVREAGRDPIAATAMLGTPTSHAQRLLNGLAQVPQVLGMHRRPMAELGDRQHRTDPFDDRPEPTWWERVQRRLLLR